MAVFHGERVVLRAWQPADLPAFAALNADPQVMEFLPQELSRAESDALAWRCQQGLDARGYGLWAVGVPGVADFIGYTGLSVPVFQAPFTPCVEIGWRFARAYWGCGYATEAARVALAVGFGPAALEEIVSFTVPANRRSRAVMERLGMVHHPDDDFDHPLLPADHRLRRHVLYRLKKRASSPPRAFPTRYVAGGFPAAPGASSAESSWPLVPSGISVNPAFESRTRCVSSTSKSAPDTSGSREISSNAWPMM